MLADTAPAWYAGERAWGERRALRQLLLGGNALGELDARLGELTALHHLEAHANQLTSLPRSFAQLQRLTVLTLGGNRLTRFPECLLVLDSLESLDLSQNRIHTLWEPAAVLRERDALPGGDSAQEVGGAPRSAPLRRLRRLDLRGNRLRTPAFMPGAESPKPEASTPVIPLPPALRTLDLSENQLQGPLPSHMFAPFRELKELLLAGNGIADSVFGPGRGEHSVLPQLRVLDLRRCHMNSLASLETSFASANTVSLAEARDRSQPPPLVPASAAAGVSPLAAHQLVRVAAVPSSADADAVREVRVTTADRRNATRAALFLLVDGNPLRHEQHRRKRGGRARSSGEDTSSSDALRRGRNTRNSSGDDDETVGDAGSALANAKLSSKKKEALGQVPCKFFRSNGCSAGDACPFAHTLPSEGQPKAVCQWFLKGSCRFGHRCALAHILPGQPMSMDRKNKRAAQQGLPRASDDGRRAEKQGVSPPDAGRGARRPSGGAPAAAPGWEEPLDEAARRAAPGASSLTRTLDWAAAESQGTSPGSYVAGGTGTPGGAAAGAAAGMAPFGTSPFSYPGSSALFLAAKDNGDAAGGAPTTHAYGATAPAPSHIEDEFGAGGNVEDFLPSSLSDLLTPAELERRSHSNRAQPEPAQPGMVSQSMPARAPGFGSARAGPGPSSAEAFAVPMSSSTFSGQKRAPMMHGRAPARPGSQSSPFMQPIIDMPLSPPSLSPQFGGGVFGERLPRSYDAVGMARTTTSRSGSFSDMYGGAPPAPGDPAYARARVPVSPAILPRREEDAEEAIFELE